MDLQGILRKLRDERKKTEEAIETLERLKTNQEENGVATPAIEFADVRKPVRFEEATETED